MSSPTVILCVDDEPNILVLRRLLLSIAGYEVLTANNGKAALDLFALYHVDLVITDQLLPGLTGVQVIAEMKRLKPEVPVVLYSGLLDTPLDSTLADLVLTKGMTPPEFLAAIAKLLSKSGSASAAGTA